MREVTVAASQMACSDSVEENVAQAAELVREAAGRGAHVVLIQELFEGHYFCQDEHPDNFARAHPADGHPTLRRCQELACELGVVLPISFFEKANNAYFNSIAMIDADGRNLGVYRKSHIPDGPGYEEKFYFSPGDTGFRVWNTRAGRLGVGICWDQWFPESARVMALQGAEILFYPTAIGSEPGYPGWDSRDHWQAVMCGHAGANLMPLVASNRIGTEAGRNGSAITFYGSSFIADWQGSKAAEAGRDERAVIAATFDLDEIASKRAAWGLFRDRRPDLYGPLMTLDGSVRGNG
jgi:N-carbamoylputrescine amidase